MAQEDPLYDYIFGFGSIINVATHAPWLSSSSSNNVANKLPGRPAVILSSFGYERGWTFRSNTGFTALGLRRANSASAANINGVVFRIEHSMLADFDRREVGYDRVPIPLNCLKFLPGSRTESDADIEVQSNETVWVYIPKEDSCLEADEDHPIIQSYVDTVMQGCIYWGGEAFAEDFIKTTMNWSPFFLNDTPSSRRPWLYRQQYTLIDRILQEHNEITHYSDRRHPEEFASAFLTKMMRGAWSIPRRNPVFTGRDKELGEIHARLTAQRQDPSNCGVAKLEVAGMGGVGKSQLCTEYCYRYFNSYYGLIIWLSAPSAESIAAGYRQLMADTSGGKVDVLHDKDTDEVVSDIKARLFRSTVPWLLVFDNLEDHSLLEKFVPNGGSAGHVLITTRLIHDAVDCIGNENHTMILGCFSSQESVELLCRAAGEQNICRESVKHIRSAEKLAEHLGHLPLALGMAAAYMRKCDVDCSEYLTRYTSSSGQIQHLGHEAVSSSLALSLEAIKNENPVAWEALRLLGWMGPDQITKKLLRALFAAKTIRDQEGVQKLVDSSKRLRIDNPIAVFLLGGVAIGSVAMIAGRPRKVTSSFLAILIAAAAITSLSFRAQKRELTASKAGEQGLKAQRNSSFSFDAFEKTDNTWIILKQFSLLVVKEGKGSMHRLLAQALRMAQNLDEGRYSLDICLHAVLEAWTFKSEDADTWQGSANILEHAKTVIAHAIEQNAWSFETAKLSTDVGIFSSMALSRFAEAQYSLEQSLRILDGLDTQHHSPTDRSTAARAATLHELGRVYRYEGNFRQAEEALGKALEIRGRLASKFIAARNDVAATLHELGVLEVRKHSLDTAANFLQEALSLRRSLESQSPDEGIEADCASTLHQLATVKLARKPPCLDEAESLLTEALGLDMQIGQRAATLKQLARVAIRRGKYDVAEKRLAQALELYVELYGESTHHINVSAVKFQQGTLAFQQEQYEKAWEHFADCLRARRQVYAYSQGNHIEVSSVLHELACVAFAQRRIDTACDMLADEKAILDQLFETSSHRQRLLQALLTNLTWQTKCAKEQGDEEAVRKLATQRAELKRKEKDRAPSTKSQMRSNHRDTFSLQQEALRCRVAARQFALAKSTDKARKLEALYAVLASLSGEIERSDASCSMRTFVEDFYSKVSGCLGADSSNQCTTIIFEACDILRSRLRDHGVEVND